MVELRYRATGFQMDNSTRSVAFLFTFYGCKLLYLHVLNRFTSIGRSERAVSVTEKTRHWTNSASQWWDLDSHPGEAYKQR